MQPRNSNRREFLKQSSAVAAATSIVPYFTPSPAFANQAKNDRPIIGCIGVGSMGTGDAHGHAAFGDIVAVCDVDSNHADRAGWPRLVGTPL